MDPAQLTRLLDVMTDSTTATRTSMADFVAAAAADREAAALNMARLSSAIARGQSDVRASHTPRR